MSTEKTPDQGAGPSAGTAGTIELGGGLSVNPLAVAAFLVARANDGPYSARQATGADQVEQEMDRCTDLGLRC